MLKNQSFKKINFFPALLSVFFFFFGIDKMKQISFLLKEDQLDILIFSMFPSTKLEQVRNPPEINLIQ